MLSSWFCKAYKYVGMVYSFYGDKVTSLSLFYGPITMILYFIITLLLSAVKRVTVKSVDD